MHPPLVASRRPSHKRRVSELFDHRLRALRRDRAARSGIETFLYDRAFADCMDRLSDVRGGFADALLIGCPDPAWPKRVEATHVSVVDPGPLMAGHAGGQCADPETLPFDGESFDLVITIGLLETANDLRLAAAALHLLLKPGGLLLGAVAFQDCAAPRSRPTRSLAKPARMCIRASKLRHWRNCWLNRASKSPLSISTE